MPASIAGATITGARLAQAMAVSASSTRPAASSPMRFAVAGANTMASAASASSMCAICCSPSSSMTSATTGRWVRDSKVRGPTNRVAAVVIATSTTAPRSPSIRTSVTAL